MCNEEAVRYTSGYKTRSRPSRGRRRNQGETDNDHKQETGTRIDEVAAGIYRICTPLDVIPGGFTFNSYLIADDEPLLFHTGYRKLFPDYPGSHTEGDAGREAALDRWIAF